MFRTFYDDSVMNVLSLFRANLIKTILFNFKVFPFRTAICFPVVFYGRCQVLVGGDNCLKINVKPQMGMLVVGRNLSNTYGVPGSHAETTYMNIKGVLELNGYNNTFANGCKIFISKGARLILKRDVLLQNRSKINCCDSIVIGEKVAISWESQLFDNNMHYLIDIHGNIKSNRGKIVIGDFCWIGNRCTIQKGAKLPDCSVVASNSIVNKDFTDQPSGVIAGTPAKLIRTGQRRLLDDKTERFLNKFFRDNPSITTVNIKDFVSPNKEI